MTYNPARGITTHVDEIEQPAEPLLHAVCAVKGARIQSRSVKIKPLVSFYDEASGGVVVSFFQFVVAGQCTPKDKACFDDRSEYGRTAQRKCVPGYVRPLAYQRGPRRQELFPKLIFADLQLGGDMRDDTP